MDQRRLLRLPLLPLLTLGAACEVPTDAATRLASAIEAGERLLSSEAGASYQIDHHTPSKSGECAGPYTVQFDDLGALIVWCRDATGETVSSHSTTYHARFVDTPRTFIVEKPARATLTIELERRHARAVIADVR